MKRRSLLFTAPGKVMVQEEAVPPVLPGSVLVQTIHSAISPGTEKLIYRGEVPAHLSIDETIPGFSGTFEYPFRYGYALVGRVVEIGADVPPDWLDAVVFGFLPHQSHVVCPVAHLRRLPDSAATEQYLFLPNLESAISFVMDGRPVIGERVLVFGQGLLGLLTTALLARFPLGGLTTFDLYENRRAASLVLGADASFDGGEPDSIARAVSDLGGEADLLFELSGAPQVLNAAIQAAGLEARIVVGSWYGVRRAGIDLGGRFHRNRLQLISSQVSHLGSAFGSRWNKKRRLRLAEHLLPQVAPERLITHRVPFSNAAEGYRLLDEQPDHCIQVILTYD